MFYDIGDPNYLFGDATSEWLMFKQLGSFQVNTVSFPVYKLTWGLVHWFIVQNIEIFCKRNESLIKWWCCGPVTIFWCWPSLIEYSSCDDRGCDWSLVFHWQAQRGQAPPTEVMNDNPVWPCLVSLTSHSDTKLNGNGNTAHGWPYNLLIVFKI